MKGRIVVNYVGGGPVSFEKFCTDNNLLPVVNEINQSDPMFVAGLDSTVAVFNGFLVPVAGHGESPAQALADYRKKIAGHLLVTEAQSTVFRREIQCPRVWLDDVN
jgi:hypothetical protein